MFNPELTRDERRFLSHKWLNLKLEEVEMRIKNLDKELRELSKSLEKKEERKKYYVINKK